jgi:hypothetical protein
MGYTGINMYSPYKYWQHECQYYNAYTRYQEPVVPKHNHSTLLWFKYQSKIYFSQASLHFSVSLSLLTKTPEMLYGGIYIVSHLKGGQCNYTSQMFNLKRLHKKNQIQPHHPCFLWILLKILIQKIFIIFFMWFPLNILTTSMCFTKNSWGITADKL